jgi:hypothetical protein
MQHKANDLGTQIQLDAARQTLINVLHDQFKNRDINELRQILEQNYGEQLWNAEQLLEEFEVSHFDPPYVHVIRKADGVAGTVAFNEDPRFYFSFKPIKVEHVRGTT